MIVMICAEGRVRVNTFIGKYGRERKSLGWLLLELMVSGLDKR